MIYFPDDFLRMREYVGEKLGESLLSVCETINKPIYNYMPLTPSYEEIIGVYDNRFSDCSPYLYRVEFAPGILSKKSTD